MIIMQRKIDKSTTIVGDLNISILIINITRTEETSKDRRDIQHPQPI